MVIAGILIVIVLVSSEFRRHRSCVGRDRNCSGSSESGRGEYEGPKHYTLCWCSSIDSRIKVDRVPFRSVDMIISDNTPHDSRKANKDLPIRALDLEVDARNHSSTEAETIRNSLLSSKSLFVVIPNPLIIPGNLLHHRIREVFRLQTLLFNQLLDFHERHDPVKVSARRGLTSTSKGTEKAITRRVCQSIASTI